MTDLRKSDAQLDWRIIDVRCPKCQRFAKLRGYVYDDFRDRLVEVYAYCRRDGIVTPTYSVWP